MDCFLWWSPGIVARSDGLDSPAAVTSESNLRYSSRLDESTRMEPAWMYSSASFRVASTDSRPKSAINSEVSKLPLRTAEQKKSARGGALKLSRTVMKRRDMIQKTVASITGKPVAGVWMHVLNMRISNPPSLDDFTHAIPCIRRYF